MAKEKDVDLKKLIKLIEKSYNSDGAKEIRAAQTRALNYFQGKYWKPKKTDIDDESKESEIFSNEFFATVMTIAPMLTDNKPIWSIRSEKPALQGMAGCFKFAGDSLWVSEEMDVKLFKAVLDSLIMKQGIWKVYFDPEKKIGGEIAIEVVDPRSYFQAPGFEDNWEAPFCGTINKRSLWWVKSTYPETGKDVKADKKNKEESLGEKVGKFFFGTAGLEDMVDEATVYELWFRDSTVVNEVAKDEEDQDVKVKVPAYPNGRYMVFTETTVLEDKPYPYNHGKPPFVLQYDYINPHDVNGISEMDQIEGLVLEYNLCLRKFASHMRKYTNRNWVMDDSSGIDEKIYKEKVLEGDQVFVKTRGSEDPKMIPVDPIDSTAMAFLNGMPTIIQNITGVSETSKGMVSKKQRQSAHEITALLETSYTRTRQRVRNLEAALKRIFTLIVELMMQYYKEPRNMSNVTENGDTEWMTVQSTPDNAKKMALPKKQPGAGEDQQENDELDTQWKDYDELLAHLGDEEDVAFNFIIDIDTNSTLPMDKQSLANLGLQLAQLGHIDNLSLLKMLHIPNAEKINQALKKEAQEKAQPAGAPPQGNPLAAMMGGQQ